MRPCTPLFRFFAISTLSDPVTFTDDRYRRDPPKVTTLYGLEMPTSRRNVVRYDDGTGDELEVPLGGTACKYLYASSTSEHLESILLTHFAPLVVVSGKVMFDLLPPEYKSLAVRMRVKYMPHPYIAIGTAKSRPTGLGMESDGLEVPFEDLPPWEEKHVKTFPVCWKNPVTGNLHVQVHPSGIHELVRRDLFSIHADRTRTPEKKKKLTLARFTAHRCFAANCTADRVDALPRRRAHHRLEGSARPLVQVAATGNRSGARLRRRLEAEAARAVPQPRLPALDHGRVRCAFCSKFFPRLIQNATLISRTLYRSLTRFAHCMFPPP